MNPNAVTPPTVVLPSTSVATSAAEVSVGNNNPPESSLSAPPSARVAGPADRNTLTVHLGSHRVITGFPPMALVRVLRPMGLTVPSLPSLSRASSTERPGREAVVAHARRASAPSATSTRETGPCVINLDPDPPPVSPPGTPELSGVNSGRLRSVNATSSPEPDNPENGDNSSGDNDGTDNVPSETTSTTTDPSENRDAPPVTNVPATTNAPQAEEESFSWSQFRDSPEIRELLVNIRNKPTVQLFLELVILKLLIDNSLRLITLLGLAFIFSQINLMVKKEASNQACRNWWALFVVVVNILITFLFALYFFPDLELQYAFIMMPTSADLSSLAGLLWTVTLLDYLVKLGTTFLKVVVIATPSCILAFPSRGRYFLFIEQLSQFYRNFIPMMPWLMYITWGYEHPVARFMGFLVGGVYVAFKAVDALLQILTLQSAVNKFFAVIRHGTPPTVEQLEAVGPMCSICHDNFTRPIRLKCTHIFCEACVTHWLDGKQTCPICRANVADDPQYRDGSTAAYIQLV